MTHPRHGESYDEFRRRLLIEGSAEEVAAFTNAELQRQQRYERKRRLAAVRRMPLHHQAAYWVCAGLVVVLSRVTFALQLRRDQKERRKPG